MYTHDIVMSSASDVPRGQLLLRDIVPNVFEQIEIQDVYEPDNTVVLDQDTEYDIIDKEIASTQYQLMALREKKRRQEFLQKHNNKIWQGKNGLWYTYLPATDRTGGRRLVKKKNRKSIEDAIITYYEKEQYNPTIFEMANARNKSKFENKAYTASTYQRYDRVIKQLFSPDNADSIGGNQIKGTTDIDLVNWIEKVVPKRGLTAKRWNDLKRILKGVFIQAKREGLSAVDIEYVFGEIEKEKLHFKIVHKEDCEEVYNDEESNAIIDYLKDHIDDANLCLLLMFASGLRVGEAVSLKHTDIGKNYVFVRRTATEGFENDKRTRVIKDASNTGISTKTEAGIRKVALPEDALWILDEMNNLHPDNEYVFLDRKRKKWLSEESVRTRLKVVDKKLGIPHRSPHKIRKTYASGLYNARVDEQTITKQMGHCDSSITRKAYYKYTKSFDEQCQIMAAVSLNKGLRNSG